MQSTCRHNAKSERIGNEYRRIFYHEPLNTDRTLSANLRYQVEEGTNRWFAFKERTPATRLASFQRNGSERLKLPFPNYHHPSLEART